MDTPDDETLVAGLLMDLRGEARFNLRQSEALPPEKVDLKGHFKDLSTNQFKLARALHRILRKAGIKGLGAIDY